MTRPWIFNKLLGSQLPAGARPALQAHPVDESRKQLPAKRQWSPEHLMSFQSMWWDSNWIFSTFQGIRSHMKTFSRSLEGFGKQHHHHCWEFTSLEQLQLTQLTTWNKNEKPWSFESFHLPFLGDARYNSSDAFPVLTRRKITKRRVVQSYHPKEIVPFRQLISLQQIYSFWLTQQKSITKLKLKKQHSWLPFSCPFFEGHHFRVRHISGWYIQGTAIITTFGRIEAELSFFPKIFVGKHVLPFT